MRRFLRRASQYLLVAFLAATLNFAIPRLMPGDPITLILGEDANRLRPEEVLQSLERFGLEKSIPEQYGRYLVGLVKGDLGYSYGHRRPVSSLLADRLPWTLLLVGTALVASTVLGVLWGTLAAWWRQRRLGNASLATAVALESLPTFWTGLLLLIVFGARLKWLPVFGAQSLDRQPGTVAAVVDVAKHLVLPAAALTLAIIGQTFLVTRSALAGVVRDDFVLLARAKGLRERAVALRHALPAASLPVVTAVFLRLGALSGGAVVVETVFSYPGVGRLLYEAAQGRDYPVMQGGFVVLSLTVIAANMVADLLYPRLDPRTADAQP
ncbi:MAG: ABC transporter permease [Actinomycetota bacterium]|nr:ABC transporter permease [Actinomycetota bacterium]